MRKTSPVQRMNKKKAGTYYELNSAGEKVLARSITVSNHIFFTTYRPDDSTSVTNCDADTGSTRLYQVSPLAGSSGSEPESGDETERKWTVLELAQGGIPPNPVVLFPPSSSSSDDDGSGGDGSGGEDGTPLGDECSGSTPVVAIGAEIIQNVIPLECRVTRSYWKVTK